MLESMRNHAQSWVAKVLLGGIALSFALWGVGDYFMGSRVEPVADVDGKPVTDLEFRQAFERQVNAYRAMMGRNLSKEMIAQLNLKDNTLQTLVNRRLLTQEAADLGLVTSESMLVNSVQSDPSFQSAGQFNPQTYRIVTRNMGFATTRDFETEMRLNLMVDALQKTIAGSARVSDEEVRTRFDRDYEQRVIAAVMIDPDSFKDIEISDEQARRWYDEHQNDYRTPERVQANVVIIDPQTMKDAIEIDEGAITTAYEDHKDRFATPEQRHARQIVIRAGSLAEEADWKKAEEKIKAAEARLNKGEDFATVATDVSDDISASEGGDLGWVANGMLPPAADSALFAMKDGETSTVIKGDAAYYLLKLEGITASGTRPLEEVHDQLKSQLQLEKARDEAYDLSQDLDDALGREDNLQAAAEATDLQLIALKPISRNEAMANKLLASSEALQKLLFRTQPGDMIQLEELDDGRFVALEVTKRLEPEVRPYKEVVASVYADAKIDQAQAKAKALAKTLLQEKDADPDAIAQKAGQGKFLSKPLRSNGLGDDSSWLTQSVIDSAFATTKGAWSSEPVSTSRGIALVYVEDVITASDEDFAAQKDQIRDDLLRSKGATRFARWVASMRDRHDIETHQDVLDRI